MELSILDLIKKMDILCRQKPATSQEIKRAEETLGVNFADEYKQYVSTYGAIVGNGSEFTGITAIKEISVIDVTLEERKYNSAVPTNMYVIEKTYMDGLILWQDEAGTIYSTMPFEKPKKFANSLAEYIENVVLDEDDDESDEF